MPNVAEQFRLLGNTSIYMEQDYAGNAMTGLQSSWRHESSKPVLFLAGNVSSIPYLPPGSSAESGAGEIA